MPIRQNHWVRYVVALALFTPLLAGCFGQLLGNAFDPLVPTPTPPPASGFRVDSMSPADGPITGGTTLTIMGNGFDGTTVVMLGATPCAIQTNDGSTLTCLTAATGAPSTETVTVTVGSDSATGSFRYRNRGRVLAGTVTKLTAAAPILRTGSSAGSDINRYLIALPGFWMPSVFHHNGNFEFTFPCKPFDAGGWYLCGARWDGSAASGTWIDTNSMGIVGVDPLIRSYAGGPLLDDGALLNNMAYAVATSHAGRIRGYVYSFTRARFIGINTATLEDLATGAGFLANINALTGLTATNDNTFTGGYDGALTGLLSFGGVLSLWRITSNAPTNDTRYVTRDASSTANVGSWVQASAPASTGLPATAQKVYPTSFGESEIVVACDRTNNTWRAFYGDDGPGTMVMGNGLGDDLLIAGQLGAPGDWDGLHLNDYQCPGSYMLIGARVVGNFLYVFYMDGDFDYPGATPYGAPRGVGVLRYAIDVY